MSRGSGHDAREGAVPATYENVRRALLVSLDFANLDMEFPRIVHWLGQLPAGERERLLGEVEAIAEAGGARGSDAAYLLDELGLRRVRWERGEVRGPAG
ncbi:hypothetical protein GCM10020229_82170 [Kitasatospora albolonga]|uniref:hypothetical protein n=1 Tax=Kitasatospora albolonga TaxID=68173 RepID=UPI0031EB599E